MVLKGKEEAPDLPKAKAKANAWKTNQTVPRSPWPQTEDPHVTLWLWGWPTCLQECTRGTNLTTVPSSNPNHESAMNQVEGSSALVLTVHGRPTRTDYTGGKEAPQHWRGQSQCPAQAWLREGGVSAGPWPWCSGHCQPNWNHLTWVQLVNSKYTLFPTISKEENE